MTTTGAQPSELVPIDQVARQLGLRASAIRYYEERGLVEPVSRRSGRRWYGAAEIRRLAVIGYWQASALMTLEEIGQILVRSGAGDRRAWSQVVDDRMAALDDQIRRMTAARAFLEHIRSHHEESPDGCPHYEALVMGHPAPRPHVDSADRMAP